MHSHPILRFLLVSFAIALIAGAMIRPTRAAERTTWTDSSSQEAQLVQGCSGFDVTTSYTVNRVHNLVEEYTHDNVFERQQVDFAGALGNSVSGKSYAYDGQYTSVIDYDKGTSKISKLSLRFEVGTPGMFEYKLDVVGFKVADNPGALVKAIVPEVLQVDVCYLLGGPISTKAGIPTSDFWNNGITENVDPAQSENVHTENSALPQPAAADDEMTPWTELDPCDSSPPGQPC